MKKKIFAWQRLPGLILLAGLGVAALVIIGSDSILPFRPYGEAVVQPEIALDALSPEMQQQDEEAQACEQHQREVQQELQPVEPSSVVSDNEKAVPTPATGCVHVSYRHKALAGHPDRERCAQHRNFIPIGKGTDVASVNWNSVCLRVDGVVTAFDRTPGGIVFGPFAGPDSRVSLKYCHGKAQCPGRCDPPRDLFLEAIGATLTREKHVAAAPGSWDPSDKGAADAAAIANPTAAIEVELRDLAGAEQGFNVFKQWSQAARFNGCGTMTNPVATNVSR